jgi:hypothetical protein
MLPLILGGIGSALGETTGSIGAILGLGLFGVAAVFMMISYSKYSRQKEYGAAKAKVDRIEKGEIDLDYYRELEATYGADFHQVLAKQKQAQRLVESFFSNPELSALVAIKSDVRVDVAPAAARPEAPQAGRGPAGPEQGAAVRCPKGHVLNSTSPFCPVCGAKVATSRAGAPDETVECGNCGATIPAKASFCHVCGQRTGAPGEQRR